MGYTEDEFTCGLCSRTARSIDEYVQHMIEDERCEVEFRPCEYIQDISLPKFVIPETSIKETKVIFINEPETTDFPKEEHSVNQWKCTLCPFTFSLYSSFKTHSLKVHSQSSFTKNYDEISTKFIKLEKINPSSSKKVLKLNEDTGNSDLKPRKFKEQKLQTTSTNNDETNFDDNSDIPEVHEILNEENSDVFVLGEFGVSLSCQLCSQSFKTSRNLTQHLSTVHNSSKPFVCSYQNCEQCFKTKGTLNRHIRTHTGERPYLCGLCGRTFAEKGTLVRHTNSKVTCVNKSDDQFGRYGQTNPFTHVDSKSAIKMLKKEEFMNNENEMDTVEEDDNNQPTIASSVSETDNLLVCPIRKVKQERFDKDTKLFANKVDNQGKLKDRTCPEVNLVEASENTQKPLLSLNIKQEHTHPKSSESNLHNTSVNNILNIKAEQRVNCDEECEFMSQSEDNGYMEDLDCQSLSSAAPPSPSSVISFNPSLVEVPVYGTSVLEHFNDFEDADIRDVKPRLAADVKPRLANFDVKPNIPNMAESSNLMNDDNLDESASASDQILERVAETKESVMSKSGYIINRENLMVRYQCPFCERNSRQPSGILKHLQVHKKSLGPACLFCNRRFVSSEGLMRHMCRHASLRRFCCTLCAGQFKHPSQYNTHCLTHRQDKKVSCDICNKSFKTVSARNLHAKGHAGIREACDVCGRTFSTKSSLLRHLMIHSGEKPFVCSHCNTPFRDSGTLTRHLKHKRPCSELEANRIQLEFESNFDVEP